MLNNKSQQKISENFKLYEILCRCGKCLYSDPNIGIDILISEVFLDKLQAVRSDVGRYFTLNCGARCEQHNKDVGGAVNSAHLVTINKPSEAVDISTVKWSGLDRYKLIRSAYKYNMWGIGIYSNFIHLDSKKSRKSIWYGGY